MLDALVDTLMALWNATWRERVLPTLFAFFAIALSAFIFLMQVGLPTFSRLSAVSGHSSVHSGKSVSLAINPRVTGSVQAVIVPTPAQVSGNTKKPPTPTPVPAPTSATSDTTYAPASISTPLPAPDIASMPGLDGSAYIGTTGIVPAPPPRSETHVHVSHHTVPPVTPAPTVTTVAASPTSSPVTPTPPATPIPPATVIPTNNTGGATPTVVVPTSVPTPLTAAPTNAATAVVPANGGGSQTATVVPPMPTATNSNGTNPAG